ncbi:MAG TPA: helix-turn-helix transcriptional regulator [Polyangia bacterium]|nr:helix-turn-helix transcriptional regulator [Polyangia bacterium]
MQGDGPGAAQYVDIFRRYVAELPPSETFFPLGNPHLVQVEQRNRVVSMAQLSRQQPLSGPFRALFRALGIEGHDQLRVLICDGPRQLAWVGATREEPFTARQVTLLRRLVKPLRDRLILERRLAAPGLLAAALDAALEALPTAAFVLGPRRTIEMANWAGLALLTRDRRAVLESIRESQLGSPDAGAFSITRLEGAGWPPHLLAIQKQSNGVAERVMLAQKRWGLSARQARVLELVAAGLSNKEIGRLLVCSEPTVENHMSELFRRSGARSRAGLVGRLLKVA